MDEQTHYRYYDIKQNACLDMIQYMKELGMELKEIKGRVKKRKFFHASFAYEYNSSYSS